MINYFDENLPPQLASDSSFLNEPEPMYKTCPECLGSLTYTSVLGGGCMKCDGEGRIEMDWDERRDYIEEKNEPDDL